MWRCCIGPYITERAEGGTLAGDGGQRVQEVTSRARQPVKPRHRHHVARVVCVEDPSKLGAVGLRAACHFLKNLLAADGGELTRLRVNTLAVCRDSCVAVNHAFIVHQIFAPEKPRFFRRLGLVQNS